MKYRANARPRTVSQITDYLRSSGVAAEVIACAGYYRFRGGDPPGGWIVPHLLGFSLDGMTFGDWLQAYHEMHAAHATYHRDRLTRRGQGFEPVARAAAGAPAFDG